MKPIPPVVVAGRVLLALIFIVAGFGKLTGLAGTAGYIASKGLPLPSVLALGAGVLELVGGIALAIGFQARWSALALAAFTLVATLLFHNYWAMPAEQQMVQQLMFMKNLAIVGGLLFVFSLGAGPASLDARRETRGGLATA
ncbi:MAG: DoxX family protein [Burkholderiales bacterium]|nr:DoxX family protein [Burkholderiales bacterium]